MRKKYTYNGSTRYSNTLTAKCLNKESFYNLITTGLSIADPNNVKEKLNIFTMNAYPWYRLPSICVKCCQYKHYQDVCTSKTLVCSICGKNHLYTECTNSAIKLCVACNANSLDAKHEFSDANCATYLREFKTMNDKLLSVIESGNNETVHKYIVNLPRNNRIFKTVTRSNAITNDYVSLNKQIDERCKKNN